MASPLKIEQSAHKWIKGVSLSTVNPRDLDSEGRMLHYKTRTRTI